MTGRSDFTWIDGERLVRFGRGTAGEAPALLAQRGFHEFVLLTTERGAAQAPEVASAAARVLHVPASPVPEAAAAVRAEVASRPVVALGGGRVIDAAKGIAGVDSLPCAAVPTTLSGAPMTAIHRMPADVDVWRLVRPSLVVADPELMASQPPEARAASAMNALAHAAEALYGPMGNPVADAVAQRAAALLARGVEARAEDEARPALTLGAILAGYAVGSAGIGLHHIIGQTLVRVTGVPHAKAYAALLPHTIRAMAPRAPQAVANLAAALGAEHRAEAAPDRVAQLAAHSRATHLASIGVQDSQLDDVAQEALARPDLDTVPDPPDAQELRRILQQAL